MVPNRTHLKGSHPRCMQKTCIHFQLKSLCIPTHVPALDSACVYVYVQVQGEGCGLPAVLGALAHNCQAAPCPLGSYTTARRILFPPLHFQHRKGKPIAHRTCQMESITVGHMERQGVFQNRSGQQTGPQPPLEALPRLTWMLQ